MEVQSAVLKPDMVHKQEMDMLLRNVTPERRAIADKLQEKEWFKKTDPEIQKQLLSLPQKGRENHDGFLEDLANRPDTVANVKVERMIDLPHGSFVLVPKFEVSRVDNPSMHYTYEYASWRGGPISGTKGVVFVEDKGETTHFIVLKGEKFATGKSEFDTIGGLYEKGADGVTSINDRIQTEFKQELGRDDITIQKIDRLGAVHPDAGLTNEAPELFTATISAEDAKKLTRHPVNGDVTELKTEAVIFPMSQLSDVVMTNSDGMFLSTIARAWAKGTIPPPRGVSGASVGFSAN